MIMICVPKEKQVVSLCERFKDFENYLESLALSLPLLHQNYIKALIELWHNMH